MLTGKTIGQLTNLASPTSDTLFPVELSGLTYHIDFSSITNNLTFEDITYSELYDKYTGATFVAGSYYRITDFQTCYDQPDYDYNGSPINSGNYRTADIDPIIVFATSNSTLSQNAYQPSYPNDSIKYDITFNLTERTSSPAKGRITERIDEFNNRTDYDHRTILFKRYGYYEISLNNPYQGTVAVADISATEMTVFGTGTNFLSTVSVGNKIGFEPNGNDYRVYEVTNVVGDTEMTITGLTTVTLGPDTKMYSTDFDEYSSYYQNNVDESSVFEEYYTFQGTDNFNNYIGNHANLYDWEGNDFLLANNVFHDRFIGNKFGDSCYNNTFFDDCHDNNIGNYFYNNITDDDFDGNVIGNQFYNNRITSNFQYNRIGENFYNNYIVQNSFYRNNIMNDFRDNEISGGDFQNNEIGNQFNQNKIKEQFYKNDIGNGFYQNKIYWGAYGNLIGNGFNQNDIYCQFYDNVIGEYFYNNTLGDILNPSNKQFYENRISVRFESNTITNNFYRNDIASGFDSNNISGETFTNKIGESFENNTIYSDFYDNQIFNEFKGNMIYQEFYSNKADWGVAANEFSGSCGGNIFGPFTTNNDFLGGVYGNTIKSNFNGNTIGDGFAFNNIGAFFNNNAISDLFQNNEIGNSFGDNTIDEGFGFGGSSTQKNYIGDEFYNNTVGEYFYNNRVGNYFQNNTLGDYFQWNVIDTDVNAVDFTPNYGNITAFTYNALGTGTTDNTYTNTFGTTNGQGVDASFNIEVSGNTVIGISGNTSGKLYNINDTITIPGTQIGGFTGVITVFSSNGIGITGTTGSYPNIFATGTGTGENSTFDVEVIDGLVDSVVLSNGGGSYQVGETLTIVGSEFGSTEDITITVDSVYSDNVIVTVTGIGPNPSVYEHYTCQIFERQGGDKRLSFYDSSDILTIKNINE